MKKDITLFSHYTGKDHLRQTPNQPILLVEDNLEHFEITLRGLRLAGVNNPVIHCRNGDDALDYVFRQGTYQDPHPSFPPGLILLDLNIPGTDGRDVLEILKKDPTLKSIPIVVLTTSADTRDVRECYARGANSYIQKPLEIEDFNKAMTRLRDYWFEVVIIPNQTKRFS